MYPKNAASPPEIVVGAVVQISDGAVQTSGTTTKVKPKAGSWTAASGTTAFGDGGSAIYTPTQAETNYESFLVEVYKSGCIPAAVAVVTTESSTAGRVYVQQLADDVIKAASFDESTAYPLKSADTGSTALARTGADSDTLETLSDQVDSKSSQASVDVIDGIVDTLLTRIVGTLAAGTHNPQSGDSYAIANSGTYGNSALKTLIDAIGAILSSGTYGNAAIQTLLSAVASYIDTEVAAIKAKTDNLPASPAAVGSAMTLTVAYDAAKTAAQASTALDNTVWTNTKAGYIDQAISTVSAPSASAVADAVWDEAISGHLTGGSTGSALNAAGSAGDPWSTSLPGAYGSGTAGKIIGDNINATISSRSTLTAQNVWEYATRTLSSFGTLVSDIATAVWGAATRTLSAFGFTVATNSDSNVTAIKAKTDNLPSDPADESLLEAAIAAIPAAPTTAEIADKILGRNIAGSSDTGRTVKDALRVLRNKVVIDTDTGIITVYAEDDTTPAWTGVVTTTVGADPITAVDPS